MRRRAGIKWELASRADQRVLRFMALACGKNGLVPSGQNVVDGGSKRRSGTR